MNGTQLSTNPMNNMNFVVRKSVSQKKTRNHCHHREEMATCWTSLQYHFDRKYKISLPTMEDWKVGCAHFLGDGDNWFTDCSKNRKGAGAGVYRKNSDTSFMVSLGPHSIVLQTESAAILQCAYKEQN